MIDQRGKRVTEQDFRGKWLLVTFGFTRCPDVCPLTLTKLTQTIQDTRIDPARLQIIFITVDPEHDTPQSLAAYLREFDPHFIGLTGSPAEVDATTKSFGAFVAKEPADNPQASLFSHSAYLYLIDPDGYMDRRYVFETTSEQLAASLEKVVGTNPGH